MTVALQRKTRFHALRGTGKGWLHASTGEERRFSPEFSRNAHTCQRRLTSAVGFHAPWRAVDHGDGAISRTVNAFRGQHLARRARHPP